MSMFKRKSKTADIEFVTLPPKNGTLYVETAWANGFGWCNHLKVVDGSTYGLRFSDWADKKFMLTGRTLPFQCTINHTTKEQAVAAACVQMEQAKVWMEHAPRLTSEETTPTLTYATDCD